MGAFTGACGKFLRFYDDGHNHGTPAQFARHPRAQRTTHHLLELVFGVFFIRSGSVFKRLHNLGLNGIEHPFVFRDTARMDLWSGNDGTCLSINDRDDGDETFFAQYLAVLQVIFGDVTYRATINVDVFRGDVTDLARSAIDEVDNSPIVGDDDIIARHAGGFGDTAVSNQVTHFAVDGQHVLGLDDVIAIQQFALRRVTRSVNMRVALVYDVSTEGHQPVDHPSDRVFIARDQGGCHDH